MIKANGKLIAVPGDPKKYGSLLSQALPAIIETEEQDAANPLRRQSARKSSHRTRPPPSGPAIEQQSRTPLCVSDVRLSR
jgi:hypothetical protein